MVKASYRRHCCRSRSLGNRWILPRTYIACLHQCTSSHGSSVVVPLPPPLCDSVEEPAWHNP